MQIYDFTDSLLTSRNPYAKVPRDRCDSARLREFCVGVKVTGVVWVALPETCLNCQNLLAKSNQL